MNSKLRRQLLGPAGRSVIYLAAGVALFLFVVEGTRQALGGRFHREEQVVEPARVEAPAGRYVPPAEVDYPFF